MTPARRRNLQRLLNPRHIALIGGRDAVTVAGECARIGYDGPVWPVNPKRDEIAGHRCYAGIHELPDAPDAVFLAIPRDAAIDALSQLNVRGAGGVVCYTAGFGEMGDDGAALEAELVEAAGDMALVGPNCYGLINYLDKVALWPFAHGGYAPGFGAAIITQSGMLASDLTMSQRSVPFAYMISAGNQAVLALEDFVEALCEKDAVRAIGLHIEGLKDVSRFAEAARLALRAGKPIVALKTGSSSVGSRLTESHTGSLSGADELYSALFDKLGIIRVTSPAQLLETLKFLMVAGVPDGPRVAGLTCSGGGATMLADYGEKIGLDFTQPSETAKRELQQHLPHTATVSNPLDYTTPIWGDRERVPPVFAAHLADGHEAAVIVQDYPAAGLDDDKQSYLNDATSFAEAAIAAQIPGAVCATLPENLDASTREFLITKGIAPMQGIHECLQAISSAVWHGERRAAVCAAEPFSWAAPIDAGPAITLDEADSKAHLKRAGIPIPDGEVGDAKDVAAMAARIGYPVVLKMVGPQLIHKTEAGAVALNIGNEEQLLRAQSAMGEAVKRHGASAGANRILVERQQQPPVAELLVSIRRDSQFGLTMTIASGGTLVEVLNDAVTILVPASESDLRAAIDGLKMKPVLSGYRGKPGINFDALVAALMRLTEMMLADPGLVEIEINPLFAGPDAVCAVDALLTKAC